MKSFLYYFDWDWNVEYMIFVFYVNKNDRCDFILFVFCNCIMGGICSGVLLKNLFKKIFIVGNSGVGN